jgi:2-polyprenyl-6-methoxyphenol hydroxylase-like FAD-dependent oxidoreductase
MEIYRSAGIEAEIRARRTGETGEVARAKNLSDPDIVLMGNAWKATSDLSLAAAATCDQDRLEPILRAHAERHGAEVRFNTEMVACEQDDTEVRVRVRDLATGREETVAAPYLVAADGIAGSMRERAGVGRQGPGVLPHWMNLIFNTDLDPYIKGKRVQSCFVTDVNGSIVPRNDRWLLAVQYQPERGERPEHFDENKTADLVRKAAGRQDVKVELVDARDWQVAAFLIDRFSAGRVFFIGDAAHAMPPTGGFGGNTGIHDAHNLAWKMAYVLNGWADPALLGTYDRERRRVAECTLAQALARLAAWFKDPSKRLPPPERIVDDSNIIFGQIYPSDVPASEGQQPDQAFEDPRHPSARPGTRAPHFVLETGGVREGIHDLTGRDFILLIAPEGQPWADAARLIGRSGEVPLRSILLGDDARDVAGRFCALYRVERDGAVLVRPDGFIAWRSARGVSQPGASLRNALKRVLHPEAALGP